MLIRSGFMVLVDKGYVLSLEQTLEVARRRGQGER